MTRKPFEMITDFVTDRRVPNLGSEANRQLVERYLVSRKGYAKSDIRPDVAIQFRVAGERYHSQIDLLVGTGDENSSCLVVKCVAGSLGSYEREALAAARILEARPIPFAVVSDGVTAVVIETVSGRTIGKNLSDIPAKTEAHIHRTQSPPAALDEMRLERERLIFRSYDAMKVNTARLL